MRRVDAGGRVAALRTECDALRTDREQLLRFLVSRPGAVAEDIDPEELRTNDPAKLIPPLYGALLKSEQDVQLFERLAFLNRRERAGN